PVATSPSRPGSVAGAAVATPEPVTGVAVGRPGGDPLAATIARVAAAVELDAAAIRADTRLLADLHLSSLRVGQLASDVAVALGRALPVAPLALGTSTVEEFAAAIAELPAAGADEPPASGVATWVRAFGAELVAEPAVAAPLVPRRWEVIGDLT